ncbi:RRXRR domain-containing protein [Lyngbya confervoides]|uniref:RRXRR domain-containing protein n=1 Tax=Lyngbya confervoides BDU141951 TaxID=1574623 RepID=A0ABD4SYL0_9CYAN|nr:RRXRR domain-containing protein [Lyngbya confervoides]MCM1981251.1 RRXRR domain-containing protein [Lyngbya confervoides BDU141951]
MNPNTRVPVLAPDGRPLMPTKYRRASQWVQHGKATWMSTDLNVYAVQLMGEPSGRKTQRISLGVDPGKRFTGIGLVSSKATLLKRHIALPFERVKARKETQKILRRARRGRRINRNLPFSERAHRQKRFSNRRGKKLPPSIRANKELEKRLIVEIFRLFPVTCVVWELVRADVDLTSGRKGARSGKGFSPVMVGQRQMLTWLRSFTTVYEMQGWQTKSTREYLGLAKSPDKKAQTPESHANDGLALAAAYFVRYVPTGTGRDWVGEIRLTSAPFRVVSRPQLYRRQLHFENPCKGGSRKRKGGTVTPWGFRSGDYVQSEKSGQLYRGWIGGYSEKNRVLSIYNHNWRRVGQFRVSKVSLIKRSNGLCVA